MYTIDNPVIDATIERAREVAQAVISNNPGLCDDSEGFAQRLLDTTSRHGVALESIRADDLYLAWSCTQGCASALERFWREFVPTVRQTALAVTKNPDVAEDVVQDVVQGLLVGRADRPAAMTSYDGRSKLQRWLRSVSVRAAIASRNKNQRNSDTLSTFPGVASDPEVALLREQAGHVVEHALRAALVALPAEHSLILQQHLVDGLSIDQLAKIYRIHRATAARRIAKAREALLGSTRSRLRAELQIMGRDLDSLIELARSRVLVSLRWFVASDRSPGSVPPR